MQAGWFREFHAQCVNPDQPQGLLFVNRRFCDGICWTRPTTRGYRRLTALLQRGRIQIFSARGRGRVQERAQRSFDLMISAPITANPHPTPIVLHPASRNPHRFRARNAGPSPDDPDPAPVPHPMAWQPDKVRAGRFADHFDMGWRRSFSHDRKLGGPLR